VRRNITAKIGMDRQQLCRDSKLRRKKTVRITRKTLFGWDGCWIDSDNILFLSQPAGEKSASLYRMPINSKNSKRLIKNARFPTVSAP